MRLIIAGSRELFCTPQKLHLHVTEQKWSVTELVSGCARGIDKCGERWAIEQNIPIRRFPADWASYGKAAGPIRNKQMAEYADAALLIWAGEKITPGTNDMLKQMKKLNKPVALIRLE